jgi:hypothetical protein
MRDRSSAEEHKKNDSSIPGIASKTSVSKGSSSTSSSDPRKRSGTPWAQSGLAQPTDDNSRTAAAAAASKDSQKGHQATRPLLKPTGGKQATAAHDHRILFLTDVQFSSTPVGTMTSWYGGALGPKNCPGDFGHELVQRWRSVRRTYCKPRTKESSSSSNSTPPPKNANNADGHLLSSAIDCNLVQQTYHRGNGDQLCLMRDVSVNTGVSIYGRLSVCVSISVCVCVCVSVCLSGRETALKRP